MGWVHNFNDSVAKSAVGRWFRLDGSGHPKARAGSRFFTEIRAGMATFFAMAYIIAVNSSITSDSGGTCVCPADQLESLCVDYEPYLLCVQEINRDLVTATAAISALTSFCMGLFANMPIGLAPGMGLNAYFTYTVVGFHGSGMVPYEVALTAVFMEGFVFVGLTLFGIRQWLARAIPASIKLATGVGIGLYLTIIGLSYSAGIGLITGAKSTPLELAGCVHTPGQLDTDGLACLSSYKMRNPTMWIGIFCGGFVTVLLMMYRVKGAIIAGILLVSIISWPRGTAVTYFPHDTLGDSSFDFFKQVVAFRPIKHILGAQKWNISGHGGQFALAFISFLYVDILDCTGTLYSMARFAGLIDERTQDFEGSSIAYTVDALGISIGSLFGTPPVTAFIESGAGISEGGKTGLTAMMTGFCFFISIFFAPIFASIPPWATGCTLIIVGCLMASAAKDINWRYMGDAIPAFLTITIMPFTYSIAYGMIAGIFSYTIINGIVWIVEKASGGRLVPEYKEEKDAWTYKIPGGILPPWLNRLRRGKKDFWRSDDESEGVPGAGVVSERKSETSDVPVDHEKGPKVA
ncbi:xanthine/uracil permease family protein-like protein [Paraphaeosphaeria sporulosa]|uniref:Xanthine/uracil permease family protein-like protein n=1 Tax=Paraphaeosphaeria sporulosa TaxID=1460663 RepID=A0A177D002_9PLEO|nr:xanthine/uracil permease family protein-like protein [Paraphaeosphaeria sporulosa]OAG12279.1 xanthine/uracil permease family protein-like protein [Paraphaeosphaeria sporulosa]